MPNDFLEIEDINVNYTFLGDKNAENKLLVVHGWNEHGSVSWGNFLEQFTNAKDTLVIALDLPGFGKTTMPRAIWGVEEYANFLFLFIQKINDQHKLGDVSWNVLGHSFGGAVALNVAVNYPETINNLILVSPAITREYKTSIQNLLLKATKFSKKLLRSKVLTPLFYPVKNLWYKLLKNQDYSKANGIKRLIMQKVIRQDQQNKLELIKCPTLIVWGDKDKFTPIHEANVVHDTIVGSKLVILPNINHGVHIHAYKELFLEVRKFLDEQNLDSK